MAAITTITTGNQNYKLLETIAITNQTAASTTVRKAVAVPPWARYATFVIDNLTLGGTSPTFDFILKGVNITANAVPDDGDLITFGGWDGITQKTAASATNTVIDVGPTITVDDSGSATASDRYGVQAFLLPWIVYEYTTTDSADDADYSGTISVYWGK